MRRVTNSAPVTGNVPAPVATSFFRPSEPASAITGTIIQTGQDHCEGQGNIVVGSPLAGFAVRPANALPLLPVQEL